MTEEIEDIEALMRMSPEDLRMAPEESFKTLIRYQRRLYRQYDAGIKPKKGTETITLADLDLDTPTIFKPRKFT